MACSRKLPLPCFSFPLSTTLSPSIINLEFYRYLLGFQAKHSVFIEEPKWLSSDTRFGSRRAGMESKRLCLLFFAYVNHLKNLELSFLFLAKLICNHLHFHLWWLPFIWMQILIVYLYFSNLCYFQNHFIFSPLRTVCLAGYYIFNLLLTNSFLND